MNSWPICAVVCVSYQARPTFPGKKKGKSLVGARSSKLGSLQAKLLVSYSINKFVTSLSVSEVKVLVSLELYYSLPLCDSLGFTTLYGPSLAALRLEKFRTNIYALFNLDFDIFDTTATPWIDISTTKNIFVYLQCDV